MLFRSYQLKPMRKLLPVKRAGSVGAGMLLIQSLVVLTCDVGQRHPKRGSSQFLGAYVTHNHHRSHLDTLLK